MSATSAQGRPEKVRGRNRITGNLNVRSRPLAPPQHPPRITIAGDVRGELQVGTLSGLLAVLPHLARSIWAGRGLKLSGDVFWAGAARRMRASRRLPCPRDPLRRARLAVAPAALAKAPAVRACHSWSRAAACAPQLLGIEPVRDVAAAYPMLRLIAVRVVIVRVVVRMAVHIHPLVRRGSCLG